MPFIFKILKQVQAQAQASSVPIYTVGPAPTSTILSNIRFYNSGGVVATVGFIFKATAAAAATNFARITCPVSSTTLFNTELTLNSGNVIEVSTSATLDIVAFGADRVS